MNYELMHKDTVIATVEINERGTLTRLVSIANPAHFPYGTAPKTGTKDPSGLIRWWENRRIPISRDDLENVVGVSLPKAATLGMILVACQGLSLSDCYWIRKEGSKDAFDDLNFFGNSFSFDLGDALVGKGKVATHLSLSPDGTSEGNLRKRWKIIDGRRVLLKSGTPPYRYEVYNEVIASVLMKHLNIPHVDYYLIQDAGELYCACDDFVGYSQDFVTAYMIREGGGKLNHESEYEFMVRRYGELGVKDAKKAIDTMLLVDYLLGNEDRHLNNFGLIRDAKTLEFLGPAPIFDTGSSLGYRMDDDALAVAPPAKWKPFPSHSRPSQLDYIEPLPDGISVEALLSLPRVILSACEAFPSPFSRKRAKAIARYIGNRVSEVMGKYGLTEKKRGNELTKTQERIMEFFHSNGGTVYAAQDLYEALGISRITAIRNLEHLVRQGLIIRVGPRKTGYWKLLDQ